MYNTYFNHALVAATVFGGALAQAQNGDSKIVPQDLQSGFDEQVQASYVGKASDGFKDGTTFSKDDVSKEPTFALGDSSGVSPIPRYTILMVDTTCDNSRTLHYARTNFKYNFDIVNIESETDAVQAYQAPGSLGETGDDRQYSFLMFRQPSNKEISDLKLPGKGENFDAKQFSSDNGFKDAEAGLGMIVKLGGQSNCDGGSSGGAAASSAASQPATSAAATSAAVTSAAASSAAASSAPASSEAAQESSAAAPASSAAASQAESAASVSAPATTKAPSTPVASAAQSSQAQTAAGEASASEADSAAPTGEATGSGAAQGSAVPSTLIASSVAPEATGSSTGTGSPALQTTAGAAELSFGFATGMVMASMLMFAGLLAW